jgi:hypothetical protein
MSGATEPARSMSAEPVALPPPVPPKKRRGCLGCLAWIGAGLLVGILALIGLGLYIDHQRTSTQLQEGITALRANDPASARNKNGSRRSTGSSPTRPRPNVTRF